MKTVDDYLNDPRITNDPDMQNVPYCIKEIHAIRLKNQDEYGTLSEYGKHCHETTAAFLKAHGMKFASL